MLQLWVIFALMSAIFFAIKDISAKKWLSKDTNSNQLLVGEYIIVFIFLSMFFSTRINFESFFSLGGHYALKALAVGGSTLLYFSMLKKYEISTVSPLINLSPLFLLFLSFIFLSEAVTATQIYGILLMIICTYFLETTTYHHDKKNPQKTHIKDLFSKDKSFFITTVVILVLMCFAAIFDKIILKTVDVYTNMFFTSIVILAVMASLHLKQLKHPIYAIREILTMPVIFVAVFSILSNFMILFAMASPNTLVSLIIPIRRSSTLFSSLFGGLLFHEKHLFRKLVATTGMILSLLLIVG